MQTLYQSPVSYTHLDVYKRQTESTPLVNPYWQYSRNKIEAEEVLMAAYRTNGFPVTIVRPSHTYNLSLIHISRICAAIPAVKPETDFEPMINIAHNYGPQLYPPYFRHYAYRRRQL